MPEEAMVVMVVAIGCGTGLFVTLLNTWKTVMLQRGSAQLPGVAEELKALRDEVRRLREQNNDVILHLDSSLTQVDRRLTHVETRGLMGGSSAAEPEPVRLTSRSGS
jgi:hypothetical protein